MSDLKLSCAAADPDDTKDSPDVMHIEHVGELVHINTKDGGAETLHFLDENRARELFNWLGVWLHGGNRS
jgi:hypothetical protein